MGSSRTIPYLSNIKGAGTTPSVGPGKAAMRVKGNASDNNNSKTPAGKPPKGMKIQREGE